MGRLLSMFHALPGPLRSAVATAHGARLRMRRSGPSTVQFRIAAQEREQWKPGQWQRWREDRLAVVLERAATLVPHYREYWAEQRRRGNDASWRELCNWPIMEKDAVRADPTRFVTDDTSLRRLAEEHTSGTTGTPLTLYRSRRTDQELYALSAVRSRGWHGLDRTDRWAMLGGQLIAPITRKRPPFWVWNAAQNQLYMSSYHLSPQFLPAYLQALVRYRVTYVFGYTSSLLALAREAARSSESFSNLKVAITNAEPLRPDQRAVIEEGLGCPVRETYGMSEMVAFASECDHGTLHEWPEVGIVELMEGDEPAQTGEAGEMICTGLLNLDMPLVRYRVGDRGRPVENRSCLCGRTLPRFFEIEGRTDDVLIAPDGRRIGRLDPVFKADLPVREAQIVQETLTRVRVRVVPDAEYTDEAGQSIARRLRDRMGEIDVIVDRVDSIPRTATGKFRAVISELDGDLQ